MKKKSTSAPKKVVTRKSSNNNPNKKGNTTMAKRTLTKNFIIGPRDAKLVSGSLKKGEEEIKAQKAVQKKVDPETKKVIQKAQPEIAARPATPDVYTMNIGSSTLEVAQELQARMEAEGVVVVDKPIEQNKHKLFITSYQAENQGIIRQAFKNAKAQDKYNKDGLDLINKEKEAEAKKKAEEEKAKKKAEKDAQKEADKGKSKGKSKGKGKDKDKTEEEGSDWPED